MKKLILISGLVFLGLLSAQAATPIRVMLLDGANNQAWQKTSPVIKKVLEDAGIFQEDVLTIPGKGGDFSNFKPDWGKYQVIVSNYNASGFDGSDAEWPPEGVQVI